MKVETVLECRRVPRRRLCGEGVQKIKEGLADLRASRKYQGTVYRGQSVNESIILDKYVNPFDRGNAIVEEKAFISTSKDPSIADEFISKSKSRGLEDPLKRPVLFRIKSKNGVDIDDISNYGKYLCPQNPKCSGIQQEVLLENDTLRIIDVKILDGGGFNIYEIFLEEF